MTDFSSYIPPEARTPGWTHVARVPNGWHCAACLQFIQGPAAGYYHASARQWMHEKCYQDSEAWLNALPPARPWHPSDDRTTVGVEVHPPAEIGLPGASRPRTGLIGVPPETGR